MERQMPQRPTLETERLIVRPFTLADAPDVQRLAGAAEIASTTFNIAHPYPDGAAEAWIGSHEEAFARGDTLELAITRREDGALVGAIALMLELPHDRAELGYWVGVPHWRQGYCTEAARALVGYGFHTLGLNRVYAMHFTRNPASGRVMQKIGMTYEGRQRAHLRKGDGFEDVELYGILRSEYEN